MSLGLQRDELALCGHDAMLLKEVLHHVGDRAAVIAGLACLLRLGSRMPVVMLPTRISSRSSLRR